MKHFSRILGGLIASVLLSAPLHAQITPGGSSANSARESARLDLPSVEQRFEILSAAIQPTQGGSTTIQVSCQAFEEGLPPGVWVPMIPAITRDYPPGDALLCKAFDTVAAMQPPCRIDFISFNGENPPYSVIGEVYEAFNCELPV